MKDNMKIYKKITLSMAFACLLVTSCSDEDFINANKNPDVLNEINPENQFLTAALSIQGQDFEAFYDLYRRIMPWMQYVTPVNGNSANFTSNIDNFSNRYDRLYTGVGDALTDLEELVKKLPAEDQARYVHMVNIARILKAYYAFYVSDIYGSVPYSNAWQARYGGILLPSYDDQQTLFSKLDGEIEQAIGVLNTAQTALQISLGNFDPYYKGDVKSWVRAGNALRLKIATRFVKRDPAKVQAIAQEVLAAGADNLMKSNAEGWVFKAATGFTGDVLSNWNPDGLYATKPIVDFMWNKSDPRLDAFFSPNGYSQEVIDVLISEGELEAGTTEAPRRYLGSFTSPDEADAPANEKYYDARTATIGEADVRVDTISLIQRRLFQPGFNEGEGAGTGNFYVPVISYAEFCFIRAELAARTLTAEDAKTFYDAGVRASIEWYDAVADDGGLVNYTEVTEQEITDYLAQPDIAFNPAKALDQISSQAYLNYFKQPQEGWALWKRNGLPNPTSVLPLPEMKTNGVTLSIPRRAPLPILSVEGANYTNQKAAYDQMAQEPGFGAGPTDAFGRVWWDKE
jgi:hypothetical protein